MRSIRVPSTTSAAAIGDQRATWIGVGRCADTDCGDRLFLYWRTLGSWRGVAFGAGSSGLAPGVGPSCWILSNLGRPRGGALMQTSETRSSGT